MDAVTGYTLSLLMQTNLLLSDGRQIIGVVAALLAAFMAATIGWHGTDRIIAWRQRADEE